MVIVRKIHVQKSFTVVTKNFPGIPAETKRMTEVEENLNQGLFTLGTPTTVK